ncbi:MAG: metal ABC transporter substrate-binding protein [Bacillus subtilis]|nr:metal ABC transporter substrate-binding protein [Bacillus subtilis]
MVVNDEKTDCVDGGPVRPFGRDRMYSPPRRDNDLYATVYPLVYLLANMTAGTGLTAGMVPGISSHDTTADWSPKQIIAMKNSGLLVYVGANLDAQIDNQLAGVFKELDEAGRIVKIENEIEFIEGVVHHHDDEEMETTTEHAEEPTTLGYDPHFWVSPERMRLVNDILCDKLVALYPEHEAQIAANHDTLETNLTALSAAYQATIDAGTKFMMTSTNLYGYLSADYGIESISISPGYHEETEQFTAQHKQEIVDDAILHGVRYIIYEKNASSPFPKRSSPRSTRRGSTMSSGSSISTSWTPSRPTARPTSRSCI